jgi:methylated-DNA-protein-cysteine methyltransferase-like protein
LSSFYSSTPVPWKKNKSKMTELTRRIIKAIRAVMPGAVSSYGDIARQAGLANGARQVVRALHNLSEKEKLPWHRIVRKDGSIALPPDRGGDLQAAMLRSEGVTVSKAGKINMAKYGYPSFPQRDQKKSGQPGLRRGCKAVRDCQR